MTMKRRHLDVKFQGLRHSKNTQSLYLQTLQGHSGDAAPDTSAPQPGRVQRTNQARIESKEILGVDDDGVSLMEGLFVVCLNVAS